MAEDPKTEVELTPIDASVILEKIQKGEPVEYDHVRIVGAVDYDPVRMGDQDIQCKVASSSIKITNFIIENYVDFNNYLFKADVDFVRGTFSSNAWFAGATFSSSLRFVEVTFSGYADFHDAKFGGYADFYGAKFSDNAGFERAEFSGGFASFNEAKFNGNAKFDGANFGGGFAHFDRTTFNGDVLTFRDANFIKPYSQEDACRRAKIVLARGGDRDAEAYHFYQEMEAIRIQNGIRKNSGLSLVNCLKTDSWSPWKYFWYDAIEWLFVQMMFGYGVHFERLIASWFVIVVVFAGIYYHGQVISGASIWYYLKISFATAIAPGYIATILNQITSGYYQAAAMVETLFGTFLWAGFIATFAKKYMK
jgi:hypothetical protein